MSSRKRQGAHKLTLLCSATNGSLPSKVIPLTRQRSELTEIQHSENVMLEVALQEQLASLAAYAEPEAVGQSLLNLVRLGIEVLADGDPDFVPVLEECLGSF